ncbi:Gfo/Idh/MocA family oxidoreductase [Rhodobacter sp. KR11]|uniref:Gfo/Idh/MocA family protein n=1 Tax=Rhodobacter sp. KR11 TaxID=2974588 RepID=UPI002223D3BD|nr:Gfo/Idh/MocA family oxidoreductase [Rhodobacter sp. KR11]MCW1920082.1 Gfo/Idh/MocA family oxidoreductase [Rhodobacter sp. KR11]
MSAVKWGILGAAKFAREHMAPAIHAAHGAELYALATAWPDKAEGFRAFAPGVKVHDSYDALLADPEVEAVYIPLPNHLHVLWTLKALAAGKHVLTEKPIAMHAREVDQIINARDAAKKLAAEAYMIVFHPQWQRAKALVEEGAIGRVLHVDAAFSYNNKEDHDNIRNKPETGGGGIRDIGVYTYGSVRFVTGAEPQELTSKIRRENGVDVWAQVFSVMQGAAGSSVGRFTYSAMTSMRLHNRQEVVFQGEKGMIRVANAPFNAGVHDQAQVELHLPGNKVVVERFPGVNQYKLQVEAFCHSVRTGAPYPCPLEFVRGTQAMIDRVFQMESEVTL